MKTVYILAFSVLAVIATVSATAVPANGAAPQAVSDSSVTFDSEPLALLKAQATSSDATLPRPL